MEKFISNHDIQICICRAAVNWNEWQDCFEHPGDVTTLPVLSNDKRFSSFCNEYDLRWIGNDPQRKRFRKAICKSKDFVDGINGKCAECLAKAMNIVRDSNRRRQMSAISKLAAFAAPDYYVAYDKYSRKGLALVANVSVTALEFYPAYLEEVRNLLDGDLGSQLREQLANHPSVPKAKFRGAFLLRVADCVLMTKGGRWSKQL